MVSRDKQSTGAIMPVRPTDMQQIFSKESLVEKVQQNLEQKQAHQQQAAAAQGQRLARVNITKTRRPDKDEHPNFRKESQDTSGQKKSGSKKKHQDSDDTVPEEEEGNSIDILA